ncbi:flagellar synthesis regulator FleN [Lachnospiraceae bacterium KM106-2]|nr:flagellar synthesis regulator FleN [Lachnospiraceae bacterium KM106-2]
MDQAQGLRNLIKKKQLDKHTAKVITVTSGKGGVGKTNVSVNIAVGLRKQGKKVIILDADFGLANVEVMLGVRPRYNLADLMFHRKDLVDIITDGPEGIGFISGGSGIDELSNMTVDQYTYLSSKLYELDDLTDYIIIDTGAGISESVMQFVMSSSEVILVVTPELTSITDAYALLKTLNHKEEYIPSNCKIRMLTNRVKSEQDGYDLYKKLTNVTDKFLQLNMEYLGAVPEDRNIVNAVMRQQPISVAFPNTQASKAFMKIAEAIESGTAVTPGNRGGIAHVFENLVRFGRNGRKG